MDLKDLPTVYDAKRTEEEIYKFWEEGSYFKADAKSNKPPYTIVIPPPNVTGVLHERNSNTESVNGCYLRIAMETRNYEHVTQITEALKREGFKIV